MSESSLLEVAQCCRKLHTLILDQCTGIGDAAIAQMFTFCTQLVHLDLTDCYQITGKCFESGGTAALRRLYIDGCNRVGANTHIHSHTLLKIMKNQTIVFLPSRNIEKITFFDFNFDLRKANAFYFLCLIVLLSFQIISYRKKIFANCTQDLYFVLILFWTQVSNKSLRKMFARNGNLTHLTLGTTLRKPTIASIVTKLKSLVALQIKGLYVI